MRYESDWVKGNEDFSRKTLGSLLPHQERDMELQPEKESIAT